MGRKKNQESHFRRQNKRRENGGARIPLPFVRKQQQQQQQRKKKKGSKTIDGWHLLLASLFDPEDVALVPFLHLLVGRKSAFAALQLLDELGRRFAGLSTNRRKRKSVNRRTAASRLPIGRRSVQSEDRRFVSSSPFFFFFFLSPGHEFLFFFIRWFANAICGPPGRSFFYIFICCHEKWNGTQFLEPVHIWWLFMIRLKLCTYSEIETRNSSKRW